MPDTFLTKLGTTRAGERSRIWLEGKRLTDHGFTRGKPFLRTWHGKDTLSLSLITERAAQDYGRDELGHVAGTDARPIIDIVGSAVFDAFGSVGTYAQVTYAKGRIVITATKATKAT